MNFYKRHLGDIAKACAHLSQGAMGAYDLLLDWLYANERPLPVSSTDLYRIGRASSKAERANVDRVISEFFDLTETGYVQKRATEEIEKANAQAETNRRIAVEREARKRAMIEARNEHESCDESLHGPLDHSCTKHQPSQTPDSRLKAKAEFQARSVDPAGPEKAPTAAEACVAMRQAGAARINPTHPQLLAGIAEGATPAMYGDAVREAIDAGKGEPFAYAITTVRNRIAEATRAPTARGSPAPSRTRQAFDNIDRTIANVTRNRTGLAAPGTRGGAEKTPLLELGGTTER